MTDMKIVSVPMPDDMYAAICDIRKQGDNVQLSIAEIVRRLVMLGLKKSGAPETRA